MTAGDSLATVQRSMGDPSLVHPLWPPLTQGCPSTSTAELAYPVEVDYAYDQADPGLFAPAAAAARSTGIDRWAPLLPPLGTPGLGEGHTPLVPVADGVYVKDESRNPTWSHKDRLNRCTVAAAAGVGAPGVVVASSGNHGASAAAYAARAGLRCVVLAPAALPAAADAFLHAYGAVVLPVAQEARWPLMRQIVDRLGLHPVSNLTVTHTGHPFGPEGYKTIAYEIFAEIGVPAAVFVPTGYGECLFGVWKGFTELRRLGLSATVPRMFACEPAAGGPLAAAVRQGLPAARVTCGPTDAYSIACPVGSYRGVRAVRESGGGALLVTDRQMREAREELARQGIWAELSSAASLAGLRSLPEGNAYGGPVVCVSTSSGFKDRTAGAGATASGASGASEVSGVSEVIEPTWEEAYRRLRAAGLDG
ncbi:threonine synthase [Streptomyces nondiastaticus]|uniref:Pyridoxal-phosphate dependent enzyme n=1 Tax=Streptomyces nondiastaticus TaxID=3154512 RepID=A0ABW6U0C2_9ACTN